MKNHKQPKRKYLIGLEIIAGLNITLDQNKIKKNCKFLDIDMSNCKSKISKRNDIAITTIGLGYNNFLQYEVKRNINICQLNKINNDLLHTLMR